jgi:hypothetical protein
VYFSAHPVDGLLYQSPDLFHDLYVYKCVTTFVFTAGDRGVTGNFSASLELGLEAAYAHMVGVATNDTAHNYEVLSTFHERSPLISSPDRGSSGRASLTLCAET